MAVRSAAVTAGTHDSFDYMIGKTRVVCNPHGYYARATNPGFLPDLVVEV